MRLSLENILIEQKYENEAVLDNKARVRIAEATGQAQSLGIENKIIDNDFTMNLLKIKIISIMPQHAIHKVWDVSCSS